MLTDNWEASHCRNAQLSEMELQSELRLTDGSCLPDSNATRSFCSRLRQPAQPPERAANAASSVTVDVAFELLDRELLIADDTFDHVADRNETNEASVFEHR